MTDSTKPTTIVPRLKKLYNGQIAAQLASELKLDNINRAPKLIKIVVSIGLGRTKDDKRSFEVATNTLRKITGQQPVETKARKSIAGFKLREGQKVGLKVTLRGNRMYEFFDRLVNVVMPRLRDFHGVPLSSFDGDGNYSIGITEQSVFPELSYEEVATAHGLEITFVTSTAQAEHAQALLKELGMPFSREEKA